MDVLNIGRLHMEIEGDKFRFYNNDTGYVSFLNGQQVDALANELIEIVRMDEDESPYSGTLLFAQRTGDDITIWSSASDIDVEPHLFNDDVDVVEQIINFLRRGSMPGNTSLKSKFDALMDG